MEFATTARNKKAGEKFSGLNNFLQRKTQTRVSLNVRDYLLFKLQIMLKNILKLEGTQELGKDKQNHIIGGRGCTPGATCYMDGHKGCPGICSSSGVCNPL